MRKYLYLVCSLTPHFCTICQQNDANTELICFDLNVSSVFKDKMIL